MSTAATASPTPTPDHHAPVVTAADLLHALGDVPLHRVWIHPSPGTATVEDVVAIDAHQDRLCELVDGTLVEKPVGFDEDRIALNIAYLLGEFVRPRKLGFLTGSQGMIRIADHQVRMPDVAFYEKSITYDKNDPAPPIAPTLAVEVLSKSNTKAEMDRKLCEYFQAGTKLVWLVDPATQSVHVHTAPHLSTTRQASDQIDGGEALPGFSAKVESFFA
jgi:Uma2 family endonuclease